MHHGAEIVLKNSVVFVLTLESETLFSSFFSAVKLTGPKEPAPRSLKQIASHSRHIPNLRRGRRPAASARAEACCWTALCWARRARVVIGPKRRPWVGSS